MSDYKAWNNFQNELIKVSIRILSNFKLFPTVRTITYCSRNATIRSQYYQIPIVSRNSWCMYLFLKLSLNKILNYSIVLGVSSHNFSILTRIGSRLRAWLLIFTCGYEKIIYNSRLEILEKCVSQCGIKRFIRSRKFSGKILNCIFAGVWNSPFQVVINSSYVEILLSL